MCCYFGCLKSWGLCEHGFDWLENTMPHGGWWRLSISFLFKALVPPGNPVSYTSPQAPVTLPCQPPACQSPLLTCPCSFPFLSVHVFGDLFSLFILMLRILITHLQDPQHLYLIKVFFLLQHTLLLVFPVSSVNPHSKSKTENEILNNCNSSSHHKS